jgi:hypothetical protein
MSKIKISEITYRDGILYHNSEKVDINSKPLIDIFDFENEDLYYVQLKIEDYNKKPDSLRLRKLMTIKTVASLLNLNIIEDITLRNEAKDSFYVTLNDTLVDILEIDVEGYDSYSLDFDTDKLTLNKSGQYTFNNNVCIESNNRTTNYFRDFLLLFNTDKNILMIDDNISYMYNLINDFQSHKCMNIIKQRDSSFSDEELAADELSNYVYDDSGYLGAINGYLTQLLKNDKNNDTDLVSTINAILSTGNKIENKNFYNDLYLEVIEALAIKLKKPEILFNELIKSEDIEDLQHGLIKLGFNLIE